MTDRYQQTLDVYKKLGKEYLNQIEPFVVKGLPNFLKNIPKGGLILDAGCAGGRDAKIFISKGYRVIGIDLVDSFLREARKKAPKAKFLKMDVRRLKFPSDYFDAIWANAVLVHIYKKDIPGILKGFHRILKLGGKLHVRVRQGRGTRRVAEKVSLYNKRIFVYFLKREMEKLVRKAGFRILSSGLFPDEIGRKEVKWIGVEAEK